MAGFEAPSPGRFWAPSDIRGNTLPPTNTYRRYWANACWMNCGDGFTRRKPEFWSESRMRENCTSGSMSGRWKRGMACGSEPPKGKPGYPDIPLPKPPRHLSTLPNEALRRFLRGYIDEIASGRAGA